jgi:hypothetical protein
MSKLIKADSRYLHGEDLQIDGRWKEFTLTIKSVGDENSALTQDKQQIPGWPITFNETPKIAVIKGTNVRLAIAALGTNDRASWVGKKITFYPATSGKTKWFGQDNVCCVRVRVPDGIPRPYIQRKILGTDLTK